MIVFPFHYDIMLPAAFASYPGSKPAWHWQRLPTPCRARNTTLVMDARHHYNHYFIYLLKWPLLACLTGTAVGVLVRLFNLALNWISLQTCSLWLWGLPVLGGLATGLIGRWSPGVFGDGTQIYIDRADRPPRNSCRLLLCKFAASLLTLGTGGSGGRVGPFVLMGSIVGKMMTRLKIFPHYQDYRVTAACGAAAGVGAIFGAPLGGGVFAAEVLFASALDYNVLFPAVLSSLVGFLVHHLLRGGLSFAGRLDYSFSPSHLLPILAATVLSAVVGMAFVYLFEKLELPSGSGKKWRWLIPALGGAGATLAACVPGVSVLGTGEGLVGVCLSGNILLLTGVLLLVGKLLATTMTVKTGGSGGLTFPSVILGALSAAIVSRVFGIEDMALHRAVICTGIAAAMASVLEHADRRRHYPAGVVRLEK